MRGLGWLAFVYLLSLSLLPGANPERATIVRTAGEARVSAEPDKVEFRFSVITYANSATEAARANSQRAEKVLAALKAQLGPESVVRTEGYRIQPNRKYSKKGPEAVTGYSVEHSVFASTKDLDKLGELLDGLSERGADQIYWVQFAVDDPSELRRMALLEAVSRARAEADAIAEALGTKVARVVSVDEDGAIARPVNPYGIGSVTETVSVGPTAPPIQIGSVQVYAKVTLTVELAQ